MGLVCINGGKSGAFNASWVKWWESVGLGQNVSLAFCIIFCFLLALVWVKGNDFDGFSR